MSDRSWHVRLWNAGIARAARRHHFHDGDPVSFLCECDDPDCNAYIKLALQPYDRLRDDYLYIVAPGHMIAEARAASSGGTFDTYRATG